MEVVEENYVERYVQLGSGAMSMAIALKTT
jgi:hypothetical protein